jgi:hypothetical protein
MTSGQIVATAFGGVLLLFFMYFLVRPSSVNRNTFKILRVLLAVFSGACAWFLAGEFQLHIPNVPGAQGDLLYATSAIGVFALVFWSLKYEDDPPREPVVEQNPGAINFTFPNQKFTFETGADALAQLEGKVVEFDDNFTKGQLGTWLSGNLNQPDLLSAMQDLAHLAVKPIPSYVVTLEGSVFKIHKTEA